MTENPNTASIAVSANRTFGDVEVLKPQSQKLNMAVETAFNFGNALSIPSIGILADMIFWIAAVSVYTRLYITLLYFDTPIQVIGLITLLSAILLISAFALTWNAGKFLIHWLYRISLIFTGLSISTHMFGAW